MPLSLYLIDGVTIADNIVVIVLMLLVSVFLAVKINRLAIWIFYGVTNIAFIVGLFVPLPTLTIVSLSLIIGGTVLLGFINSGMIRKFVVKPPKIDKTFNSKSSSYNQEKLINNIVTAVNWLSKNRVGALITFERETDLGEFMKSGSIINCPVTPEIIETIFYEGTRLHDGAIIIRGDTIVAAAVYYPPTTSPQLGKFGARHRAALGISEVTDAVTIVVSEETGRISITHGGMIDSVKSDEFEKIFRYRLAGQKNDVLPKPTAPVAPIKPHNEFKNRH
ncbi:MAG: DNA integrity scanning protein DisA nucleotide-binding domain protein [Bacilli bacterium]